MPIPRDDYRYDKKLSKAILYKEIDPTKKWDSYNIHHELTDKGMERFSADWNAADTIITRCWMQWLLLRTQRGQRR